MYEQVNGEVGLGCESHRCAFTYQYMYMFLSKFKHDLLETHFKKLVNYNKVDGDFI